MIWRQQVDLDFFAWDQAIGAIDEAPTASVEADETAKRLMTIPGFGLAAVSAVAARIPGASVFASEREFRPGLRPDAPRELFRGENAAFSHRQ